MLHNHLLTTKIPVHVQVFLSPTMLENRLLIPLHISLLHEVWEYYWPNLAYCIFFGWSIISVIYSVYADYHHC